MALKTQGTQLYVVDPDSSGGATVLAIECSISIDGVGSPREQIDITCLEDAARRFTSGLGNPGAMTVAINFDPTNASHVRLHEMFRDKTTFNAAIGFGDGTSPPTISSEDNMDFPPTRTFLHLMDTYVSDYPFNFSLNAVVTANLSFQLSGDPILIEKVS